MKNNDYLKLKAELKTARGERFKEIMRKLKADPPTLEQLYLGIGYSGQNEEGD